MAKFFSCPVKNSVNGAAQFNTPTFHAGTKFENVRLGFKDDRIIKATGNHTKRLNEILDTEAGGRYVGESIPKDGLFLPKDLNELNPQNLK